MTARREGTLKPPHRLKKRGLLLPGALLLIAALLAWAVQSSPPVDYLRPEILAEYPHDTEAYTQGLVWDGGRVYESTGKYGRSELREVDLESGRVLRRHHLESRYFGEGLELVDDRLVQLTWTSSIAVIYDLATFEKRGTFSYRGQGWGLCFSDGRFYMSNGSDQLVIREPERFLVVDRRKVTMDGSSVSSLNELACVDGVVWANIWNTDRIVGIDPGSGQVMAVVDASHLHPHRDGSGEDVLNGIAYIPERRTFLLTGKHWPRVFEVRFVPHQSER